MKHLKKFTESKKNKRGLTEEYFEDLLIELNDIGYSIEVSSGYINKHFEFYDEEVESNLIPGFLINIYLNDDEDYDEDDDEDYEEYDDEDEDDEDSDEDSDEDNDHLLISQIEERIEKGLSKIKKKIKKIKKSEDEYARNIKIFKILKSAEKRTNCTFHIENDMESLGMSITNLICIAIPK
jgi:hypothetical protein